MAAGRLGLRVAYAHQLNLVATGLLTQAPPLPKPSPHPQTAPADKLKWSRIRTPDMLIGFWVAPSVEADKFVLVNLKFAIKIGFVPLRNTMRLYRSTEPLKL